MLAAYLCAAFAKAAVSTTMRAIEGYHAVSKSNLFRNKLPPSLQPVPPSPTQSSPAAYSSPWASPLHSWAQAQPSLSHSAKLAHSFKLSSRAWILGFGAVGFVRLVSVPDSAA